MSSREARFRAAQLNFWLMRCGIEPIWAIVYFIKVDA